MNLLMVFVLLNKCICDVFVVLDDVVKIKLLLKDQSFSLRWFAQTSQKVQTTEN